MKFSKLKKYQLSDFCEPIRNGYSPKSSDNLDYIGLEHIEQQTLRITGIGSSSDITSNKFKFESGDILFGKLRPYFRKVYRPKFSGICSTDISVFRAKKNFDQGFLFYFLANKEFIDYSSAVSSGTRMPRADWSLLKNSEWLLPDLKTQNRITSILSSLDDAIELNQQINKTLEEMAKALFKEWFVDFNFPNATDKFQETEIGKIPVGWKVGKLGDIYKTTSGGTPSRAKVEYYENGIYQWIKSKELNNTFIIVTEEKITATALRNSSAKILPAHSVLIAMYGATVGEIGITSYEATCNQAIAAFLPNENYPFSFIYQFLLLCKQDIISQAVGSAQQNISQQLLVNYKLIIPPATIVKAFHKIVEPMFLQVQQNIEENQSLSKLRDTLLPRLMKGEIEMKA